MITGFEDITASLSDDEKLVAEMILPTLKQHVGKDNAVKNVRMRTGITKFMQQKTGKVILLSSARMRKILHYIRVNHIPNLCATSDGYYVAANAEELKEYMKGLRQRIGAQVAILNAAEDYFNKTYNDDYEKTGSTKL